MRGYFKLLALYSLVATTALFLASLLYIPRPENFLFLLLFLPTAIFFWLNGPSKLTSEKHPAPPYLPRNLISFALVILLTLLITNFTLYSYLKWGQDNLTKNDQAQLNSQNLEEIKKLVQALQSKEASSQPLLKEIEAIKKELAEFKSDNNIKNEVLGLVPSSASAKESLPKFITINTKRWQTLDVFKDKKTSSSIIAQIKYGKNYPISAKESDWYRIMLPDGREGWVGGQYLKEVSLTDP